MIQELLGGGSATPTRLLGERTYSNSLFSSTCPSSTPLLTTNSSIGTPPPYTTSTSTAVANSANNSTGNTGGGGAINNSNSNNNNNSNNNGNNNNNNLETNSTSTQNLRCPRCDSTNTKFCYYNNYNLTQPRHFCKTCRRYWTKGGTLRNVPIGGGCRKNKSTISSNSSSPSSMSTKSSISQNNFMSKCNKATFSSDLLLNDHSSLFLGNGLLDHTIQSSGPGPLLWSSPPPSQNSHILALLRGSSPSFSNPNPNPNPNPSHGSSVFTTLGLDSYSNGAPSLLGSFTRSNQQHLLNGFAPDFVDNNGGAGAGAGGSNIMDLYQRLKSSNTSSTNYGYCSGTENNSGPTLLGHMVGSSSSSTSSSMNTTLFETTPLGGGGDHLGGYGFMMSTTPPFSNWSEFPAVPINGAYP
ncbi:hypothetical protein vseg_005179 [Gypsophila vaccaria]